MPATKYRPGPSTPSATQLSGLLGKLDVFPTEIIVMVLSADLDIPSLVDDGVLDYKWLRENHPDFINILVETDARYPSCAKVCAAVQSEKCADCGAVIDSQYSTARLRRPFKPSSEDMYTYDRFFPATGDLVCDDCLMESGKGDFVWSEQQLRARSRQRLQNYQQPARIPRLWTLIGRVGWCRRPGNWPFRAWPRFISAVT